MALEKFLYLRFSFNLQNVKCVENALEIPDSQTPGKLPASQ